MTSDTKSIRTATCSAEFIASTDDLLIQILLQLPIKSIAKFKSVSKHWLSLISTTPEIARLSKPVLALLMHHRNNLDLMPLDRPEATPPFFPFRSLSFSGDLSRLRVESSEGLLLCYQPTNSTTMYYVCNPTTNHYATLPPALPQPHNTLVVYANIAFDPSQSPYYKVVAFLVSCSRSRPYTCQVDTYSSETRQWSRSGDSFELQLYPHGYTKRVFWSGAIHWITKEGSFRFEMLEEKMILNPMPPINNDSERIFKYFGVSRGQLYLINGSVTVIGHLNIYQMESDCSCWNLKHRVDVTANPAASFPYFVWGLRHLQMNNIMFFADQDSFLVVMIANQVIRYDFKIGTFRRICELPVHQVGIDLADTPLFRVYPSIESLSSGCEQRR